MAAIKTGKTQVLEVLRKADFGVYLGVSGSDESVLLPKKQVPETAEIGSEIEVFVYRDSEDRLISTTNKPLVQVGEFARLRVKGVSRVGAFLDWGLEKDLFLPFKEQEYAVSSGDNVIVYVYLDKSDRLAATMRLYDHLSTAEKGEFIKDDAFTGFVYRVQRNIGAFTAVCPKEEAEDGSFSRLIYGLIPAATMFTQYRSGDSVNGRVVRVRNDGKLDLSARDKAYKMLDEDGEAILKKIDEFDGELPFSESAAPELIKRELNMSKNSFKKALGHLLKDGKIEIREDSVVRK